MQSFQLHQANVQKPEVGPSNINLDNSDGAGFELLYDRSTWSSEFPQAGESASITGLSGIPTSGDGSGGCPRENPHWRSIGHKEELEDLYRPLHSASIWQSQPMAKRRDHHDCFRCHPFDVYDGKHTGFPQSCDGSSYQRKES